MLGGRYDSEKTFDKWKKRRDFAIGIVQELDGERIALDEEFYQIKVDRHVKFGFRSAQNAISKLYWCFQEQANI